ncbi:hypothetical protein ASG33_07185 [Dyadobacter sp. Leaf189]|nr:hypothetical protein ASG33_07185 [Dyadobacter sp. Leaf189]
MAFGGTTYAVVVAIADYKNFRPREGDLTYTVSDATRFYNYLRSNAGGNIPTNQMRYITNDKASKAEIISAVQYIFKFAKSGDKVIFYFSGHGDKGAFLPYDTRPDGHQMLQHSEIKELFKACRAGTKICIADACYSGSITRKDIQHRVADKASNQADSNVVLLMSSRPDETSLESAELKQGLFSYYLIRGLQGHADTDRNRKITIKELFGYVHKNVSAVADKRFRSSQHPMAHGRFSKEMIITAY